MTSATLFHIYQWATTWQRWVQRVELVDGVAIYAGRCRKPIYRRDRIV